MPNPNIISFLLRAKNRVRVLDTLTEKKVSAQIEKQTGMYKSHVNRTLKELLEKKLIKCINPKDRSYKFYKLTIGGKKALSQVIKILKEIK